MRPNLRRPAPGRGCAMSRIIGTDKPLIPEHYFYQPVFAIGCCMRAPSAARYSFAAPCVFDTRNYLYWTRSEHDSPTAPSEAGGPFCHLNLTDCGDTKPSMRRGGTPKRTSFCTGNVT